MTALLVGVIDKQTGGEFDLRIVAESAARGASRLFDLGFVVGDWREAPALKPDPDYREDARRLKEMNDAMSEAGLGIGPSSEPRGKVCAAQGSSDLQAMIAALSWESHPIDRHFLLQGIVRLAYTIGSPKGRSAIKAASRTRPEQAWTLVEPFGWQWIVECDLLKPHLRHDPADSESSLLSVTVFDDLRKHLKARGFPSRASDIRDMEARFYGDPRPGADTPRERR